MWIFWMLLGAALAEGGRWLYVNKLNKRLFKKG